LKFLKPGIFLSTLFILFVYLLSTDFFRLRLAEYYIKNKEYDNAINCYQDITRSANAKGEFPIIVFSEEHRKTNHKKTLNMLVNAYVDSAKLHLKAGKNYRKAGLTQKAIDEFNMVFALDESFGLLLPFRYMEAKEKWGVVLERSITESIQCFILERNWDEVIDKHLKLAKMDFGVSFKKRDFAGVFGLNPLGETKAMLDSFTKYQELLEIKGKKRLLKIHLSKLYFEIAKSFEESSKFIETKAYDYAVEVNPFNITAILKLTQLHPNNWHYYYLSGEFYSSSKHYNYNKAKLAFDKVLSYKPEAFEGYYGVGKLFYLEKDYSRAAKWLKKATLINGDGNSFYILSDIYRKRGRRVKASEYIRKAYYKNCDRMQRSVLGKYLEEGSFLNYYNSEITYSYTVLPNVEWGQDSVPPTNLIASVEKWTGYVAWNNLEKGMDIVFDLKEKRVIRHISLQYCFWNSDWAFPKTLIYMSDDNVNYKYVGELQQRLFDQRGYKGSTIRDIDSSGRYIKLAMQQMNKRLSIGRVKFFPAGK